MSESLAPGFARDGSGVLRRVAEAVSLDFRNPDILGFSAPVTVGMVLSGEGPSGGVGV